MQTDSEYTLRIKRAYLPAEPEDGYRILVDRLWPRGISKAKVQLNAWDKEVSPSSNERKKFHGGLEDFAAFEQDYLQELENSKEAADLVGQVRELLKSQNVTLIYGSKDSQCNNAAVLKEWLEKKLKTL